ncbi:hypothetical protein KKP91_03850 [Methanothermococcus sp. SCGC AD-155-M21]|nr:hypothetical protein [Methanothermococcus sp. SCGC AD-155-M21]
MNKKLSPKELDIISLMEGVASSDTVVNTLGQPETLVVSFIRVNPTGERTPFIKLFTPYNRDIKRAPPMANIPVIRDTSFVFPTTYVPIAAYGLLIVLALLAIYKVIDIIISNNNLRAKKIIILLLALTLVLPPLSNAVPFNTAPTFNNGWKEGLDWIKNL